jgi:hypothetical protein
MRGISSFISIVMVTAFVLGASVILLRWAPSLIRTQTASIEPEVEKVISCAGGLFDISYTKACKENLKKGLVLWLKLDEGNGTIAYDSSDYGNNGTLYNGTVSCANPPTAGAGCPEWVDGNISKAIKFDGINDYVEVADSPELQLNASPFTLESWIKTTDVPPDHTIIIEKGGWETGEYALQQWGGTGNVTVQSYDLNPNYLTSDIEINDGNWHHVVGIYTGSALQIWIDGVLNKEVNVTGTRQTTTATLTIGSRQGTTYFFEGIIDEVRVYNRALSEDEIKALYYEGLTNKFNVTFSMLNSGSAHNIGYNFSAAVFLSNGTLINNYFDLANGFGGINPYAEINLNIDNYYPGYGLIDKLMVCSRNCPGICDEIKEETQC